MVNKTFCDRCGKELEGFENEDEFGDIFGNEEFGEAFGFKSPVLKPQLCLKCQKGYDKIIKNTNKQIKRFLKEK